MLSSALDTDDFSGVVVFADFLSGVFPDFLSGVFLDFSGDLERDLDRDFCLGDFCSLSCKKRQ